MKLAQRSMIVVMFTLTGAICQHALAQPTSSRDLERVINAVDRLVNIRPNSSRFAEFMTETERATRAGRQLSWTSRKAFIATRDESFRINATVSAALKSAFNMVLEDKDLVKSLDGNLNRILDGTTAGVAVLLKWRKTGTAWEFASNFQPLLAYVATLREASRLFPTRSSTGALFNAIDAYYDELVEVDSSFEDEGYAALRSLGEIYHNAKMRLNRDRLTIQDMPVAGYFAPFHFGDKTDATQYYLLAMVNAIKQNSSGWTVELKDAKWLLTQWAKQVCLLEHTMTSDSSTKACNNLFVLATNIRRIDAYQFAMIALLAKGVTSPEAARGPEFGYPGAQFPSYVNVIAAILSDDQGLYSASDTDIFRRRNMLLTSTFLDEYFDSASSPDRFKKRFVKELSLSLNQIGKTPQRCESTVK